MLQTKLASADWYPELPQGEAGERSETDEGLYLTLIRPAGTFPQGEGEKSLILHAGNFPPICKES